VVRERLPSSLDERHGDEITMTEVGKPAVRIVTSRGTIVLELEPERTPDTVRNFLRYAREGFYEGTLFHRVIPGFMIQGGGLTEDMGQKPGHGPIRNEADNGLRNEPGTIAMARTSDPHSATSQFFINVAANDFLNHRSADAQGWGYCVFGRVIEGEETVADIAAVPTTRVGHYEDVPEEPVLIERVEPVDAGD
jgi:peptidyl-prolyl cis-trans isomerase B (cyclophilin B)